MTVEGLVLGVFVIIVLMVLIGIAIDHKVFKRVVIVEMKPNPYYLSRWSGASNSRSWSTNVWEAQMFTWSRAEGIAYILKGRSHQVVECWQVNRVQMWLHRLVGRPTVNR